MGEFLDQFKSDIGVEVVDVFNEEGEYIGEQTVNFTNKKDQITIGGGLAKIDLAEGKAKFDPKLAKLLKKDPIAAALFNGNELELKDIQISNDGNISVILHAGDHDYTVKFNPNTIEVAYNGHPSTVVSTFAKPVSISFCPNVLDRTTIFGNKERAGISVKLDKSGLPKWFLNRVAERREYNDDFLTFRQITDPVVGEYQVQTVRIMDGRLYISTRDKEIAVNSVDYILSEDKKSAQVILTTAEGGKQVTFTTTGKDALRIRTLAYEKASSLVNVTAHTSQETFDAKKSKEISDEAAFKEGEIDENGDEYRPYKFTSVPETELDFAMFDAIDETYGSIQAQAKLINEKITGKEIPTGVLGSFVEAKKPRKTFLSRKAERAKVDSAVDDSELSRCKARVDRAKQAIQEKGLTRERYNELVISVREFGRVGGELVSEMQDKKLVGEQKEPLNELESKLGVYSGLPKEAELNDVFEMKTPDGETTTTIVEKNNILKKDEITPETAFLRLNQTITNAGKPEMEFEAEERSENTVDSFETPEDKRVDDRLVVSGEVTPMENDGHTLGVAEYKITGTKSRIAGQTQVVDVNNKSDIISVGDLIEIDTKKGVATLNKKLLKTIKVNPSVAPLFDGSRVKVNSVNLTADKNLGLELEVGADKYNVTFTPTGVIVVDKDGNVTDIMDFDTPPRVSLCSNIAEIASKGPDSTKEGSAKVEIKTIDASMMKAMSEKSKGSVFDGTSKVGTIKACTVKTKTTMKTRHLKVTQESKSAVDRKTSTRLDFEYEKEQELGFMDIGGKLYMGSNDLGRRQGEVVDIKRTTTADGRVLLNITTKSDYGDSTSHVISMEKDDAEKFVGVCEVTYNVPVQNYSSSAKRKKEFIADVYSDSGYEDYRESAEIIARADRSIELPIDGIRKVETAVEDLAKATFISASTFLNDPEHPEIKEGYSKLDRLNSKYLTVKAEVERILKRVEEGTPLTNEQRKKLEEKSTEMVSLASQMVDTSREIAKDVLNTKQISESSKSTLNYIISTCDAVKQMGLDKIKKNAEKLGISPLTAIAKVTSKFDIENKEEVKRKPIKERIKAGFVSAIGSVKQRLKNLKKSKEALDAGM